ncbi:MAG: hypothetical protein IJ790_03995 [Lachnospiraceae bacterium]|nr:hypothetical protein [Lachnospiraceae bacterium]
MSISVTDTQYKKIISLTEDLMSQVKAEALVSLRFLDVALYKLKHKYDFNTTIYTDGTYLIMNPYHIFKLYKEEYNMLLRTYLHVILHCILFHLFVDKAVDDKIWNLACDISVENIINEFSLSTLISDKDNPEIAEINVLRQKVDELTAEKIYRYFVDTDISNFEIERLSSIFARDDHTHWYNEELKGTSSNDKENKNDDYNSQEKDEINEDDVERTEHEEKSEDKEKESNNKEDYNDLLRDREEEKDDEENGDDASNVDGDKNKSDTGEDENPDADSTNKSDVNEDSKNEEERLGGEETDRDVKTKNIDENKSGDEYKAAKEKLDEHLGKGKEKTDKNDLENKDESASDKNAKTMKTKKDDEKNSSYYDWKNISERTKEDLLMFENAFGNKTHTIKQYIEFVNEEHFKYEDFLEKFAVMNENVELNDDEFDNVYYTFGLNMYKNIPLVEPLEYKESNRIKDFVIAIDVSGSVKGELVEKFLEKTYNILVRRDNYFNKVNIHIVLCDAEIKDVYKVTTLSDIKMVLNNITLSGFGGTDFRPVFDYVEKKKEEGELRSLKGLIYFTDGFGEYPKNIPSFETAFVFLKDQYKRDERKIHVPPWAIKLVLEDV